MSVRRQWQRSEAIQKAAREACAVCMFRITQLTSIRAWVASLCSQ
jgi:ribosomal protein L37AE/L43A